MKVWKETLTEDQAFEVPIVKLGIPKQEIERRYRLKSWTKYPISFVKVLLLEHFADFSYNYQGYFDITFLCLQLRKSVSLSKQNKIQNKVSFLLVKNYNLYSFQNPLSKVE